MATYKDIKGTSIEVVSSDPSNPVLGQIWYNTTSQSLKGLGVSSVGAWSTGGNLGAGRYGLAGAGTQTAGLAVSGEASPGLTNATEEWTAPDVVIKTVSDS